MSFTSIDDLVAKRDNITVDIIDQSDAWFANLAHGKTIVGTYDPNRKPNDNEIVIVIGDYPVGYSSLCFNNPVYRNYRWALNFKYDIFEGSPAWNNIDRFYVINQPSRGDRLFDILKEFKRAYIPLNKVKIQPAVFGMFSPHPYVNSLFGCFKSHQFIFKELQNINFQHVAIFEDDFTFSDPIAQSLSNIETFFKKGYDYDVTLLATSALGKIEPVDELMARSYQECTTTSGYLLSPKGLEKIFPIWQEALSKLLYTNDFNKFACDRYWSLIQKDNQMLTFNNKIGYQRPSISQTTNTLAYNLD